MGIFERIRSTRWPVAATIVAGAGAAWGVTPSVTVTPPLNLPASLDPDDYVSFEYDAADLVLITPIADASRGGTVGGDIEIYRGGNLGYVQLNNAGALPNGADGPTVGRAQNISIKNNTGHATDFSRVLMVINIEQSNGCEFQIVPTRPFSVDDSSYTPQGPFDIVTHRWSSGGPYDGLGLQMGIVTGDPFTDSAFQTSYTPAIDDTVDESPFRAYSLAPIGTLGPGEETTVQVLFESGVPYAGFDWQQVSDFRIFGGFYRVNRAPVADAGADRTVEAGAGGTAAVTFDGTGSSDPDGDSLTCSWTWSGGGLVGTVGSDGSLILAPAWSGGPVTGASPTITLPLGDTTVRLTVTDPDGRQSTDTVVVHVVDTTGPAIGSVTDLVVEATSAAGASVAFGTPSVTDAVDPSPSLSSYPWSSGDTFPLGVTTVTWTAVDDRGNTSTRTFTVTVRDTTAPSVTASVSHPTLWPANHKYKRVTVTITATDAVDAHPAITYDDCWSDQDDDATGDGDGKTTDDIVRVTDLTFDVRAERAGNDVRTYTISYVVSDFSGNATPVELTITVQP